MLYSNSNLTAVLFLLLLFFTLTIWTAVDVYLIYTFGNSQSFSGFLYRISSDYPIIPCLIGLAIGLVLGHLYWKL